MRLVDAEPVARGQIAQAEPRHAILCTGVRDRVPGGGVRDRVPGGAQSGLVRNMERVFGNESTVERDSGAGPAGTGLRGGRFRARDRVAAKATPAVRIAAANKDQQGMIVSSKYRQRHAPL